MRIGDVTPHVAHDLAEELRRLAMGFKSFPFHIHCTGHGDSHDSHRDKFTLYWTTKKEHFARPDRQDIVSELYCQVVGLHDDQIILNVKAHRHKTYPGQEFPQRFDDHAWYKQDWREEYFLVEAKASAIWMIMEAHADFERPVAEVHNS